MVSVSTQTTAASTAARRAVKPIRCSDRCSIDSVIDRLIGSTTCSCAVRVVLRPTWGAVCGGLDGEVARRPRTESPAFPGRDAGERRFESLADKLFQPIADYFGSSAYRGNARSPA